MRICCVSDLHGHLPEVPDCDLLLIAGDVVPLHVQRRPDLTAIWLDTAFRAWSRKVADRMPVVGIAGNHDFAFERNPDAIPPDLPWTYLQDAGTEVAGLKVWGSPWQPTFHNWAFNLQESCLGDREEHCLATKWELIPDDTDVLVTHGPPRGVLDSTWCSAGNLGSYTLRDRVSALRLKLHVFGHIHGGYGVRKEGGTTFVNASLMDEEYRPFNAPVVVEL